MQLIDDNIVEIKIRDNSYIELTDSKEQYEILKTLTKGLSSYVLLVYSDKSCGVSNAAKEYSANPELKKGLLAEAIVTNHLPYFVLSKLYTKFFSPTIPIRLFRDDIKAKEWLKNYC